jgi:hypothetical protein
MLYFVTPTDVFAAFPLYFVMLSRVFVAPTNIFVVKSLTSMTPCLSGRQAANALAAKFDVVVAKVDDTETEFDDFMVI